ncbi:HAD family hydrolase [Synechocystis sp. FACHB-383]|uniref:HAD family hydrolase n=1 Tax=Synechocystis sp. FACHB-383 TaxID=2692864 RepID=UPI00168A050C|nr:HAD family hydrolase [Synechocystis sp. FACHB-383]MBD2655220.1 HAD family hydrolase [Synechocystis sp. FACHB-383]
MAIIWEFFGITLVVQLRRSPFAGVNLVSITIQNKTFTQIQALIFDKDGTLENSKVYLEKLTVARLALLEQKVPEPNFGDRLAGAYGFNRSNEQLDPGGLMAVGSRRDNLIAAASYIAEQGHGWFQSLEIANQCFDQADRQIVANADTCPMFPNVVNCLQQWRNQGVKIAILSAARQKSVERFIADHQLQNLVDVAKGSDQGLSKPDPALYLLTCQELGVKPAHTLMIGDAQGDITMAKGANAQGAIAIHWPGYPKGNLLGADVTIADLEQIQCQP